MFMNSENSKTSKRHVLKLKLTDKLDLRLDKKVVAISNLSIYYTWKNIKDTYNNNKFKKYLLQHGMKNLNYRMDLILHQTFKIISNIL